jgi:hypothetical protein
MLTAKSHRFFRELEADSSLFAPEQLRERLELLDALDAGFGDLGSAAPTEPSEARIHRAVQRIRTRLEAVNEDLYRSIRSEILLGIRRHTLLRWFRASASRDEKENPAPGFAAPGFAYDWQDELLSGILRLREPVQANPGPAREMVFYQPTPARHILRLVAASALSRSDVLVDLGSGLGHVPMLASMLTGARSIGIEVEAAYVASAQECARSLKLSRVQFIHQDARFADLSRGTIFYLYSPFTGAILGCVLNRLRKLSTYRSIRICTLGPCTCTVASEPWLRASALPDPDRITVFEAGS